VCFPRPCETVVLSSASSETHSLYELDIKYQNLNGIRNMSQHHGDEIKYVADDNEMSEVEDYYEYDPLALGSQLQENPITDTTAAETKWGKDIQDIPWDRLSII
ncbi:hypothetical protein CR513_16124, partial [Mucuna pruriens]